jgi:hypothetical protein
MLKAGSASSVSCQARPKAGAAAPPTGRHVTPYTLRKCLIFRGCDGVTPPWQYDRHAASNW